MHKILILCTIAILLIACGPRPTLLPPPTWEPEAAPSRFLVKFQPQVTRAEALAFHQAQGARLLRVIPGIEVHVVEAPEPVAQAYALGPTEYVEPDWVASVYAEPNDPEFYHQWGLLRVRARQAWDLAHGAGVTIAILDTGVDTSHPDLNDKITGGYDFVNRDPDPNDDHGHGTHVAGIAAAETDNGLGVAGLAWDARIMPIKVLSGEGRGYYSTIAEGIIWASSHGARVINMSFGGPMRSQALQDAVDYAWKRGVVLVAAAGNEATSAPTYPAACEHVIAVTATDQNDQRPYWANYGDWVDVAAPGVGILSTVRGGGYQAWRGTSMASPFAAGLAALLISQDVSPAEVEARMKAGCDHIHGLCRINAYRALTEAPLPTPTPTATPTIGPTPTPGDEVQEVIRLINEERVRRGLAMVSADGRLMAAAQRHAGDMATHHFLGHTGSDGSTPYTRVREAGYRPIALGEVCGRGQRSPREIVDGWLTSPGHRAVILGAAYTEIGVGYAFSDTHYWTADLASPFGFEPTPTVTPTPTFTPTPATTPMPGQWRVIISGFRSREEAEAFARHFREAAVEGP